MRYQANRSRNIALMERVTDVCVKCLYHLNSLPNRLFPQKNIHGLITSSDPQHEKLTVERVGQEQAATCKSGKNQCESRSDVDCGHGGNPGQIMFHPGPRTLYSLFPKCGFFVAAAHIDYKQGTDGEMGKEGRMTRGEGDTCTNAEMIAILELLVDPCEKQFSVLLYA